MDKRSNFKKNHVCSIEVMEAANSIVIIIGLVNTGNVLPAVGNRFLRNGYLLGIGPP